MKEESDENIGFVKLLLEILVVTKFTIISYKSALEYTKKNQKKVKYEDIQYDLNLLRSYY